MNIDEKRDDCRQEKLRNIRKSDSKKNDEKRKALRFKAALVKHLSKKNISLKKPHADNKKKLLPQEHYRTSMARPEFSKNQKTARKPKEEKDRLPTSCNSDEPQKELHDCSRIEIIDNGSESDQGSSNGDNFFSQSMFAALDIKATETQGASSQDIKSIEEMINRIFTISRANIKESCLIKLSRNFLGGASIKITCRGKNVSLVFFGLSQNNRELVFKHKSEIKKRLKQKNLRLNNFSSRA